MNSEEEIDWDAYSMNVHAVRNVLFDIGVGDDRDLTELTLAFFRRIHKLGYVVVKKEFVKTVNVE